MGVGTYLYLAGRDSTEVTLEPIDYTSPENFMANFDADDRAARQVAESEQPVATREIPDPRSEDVETVLAGQVAPGSAPALYGGSRDTRVCDVEAMVDFLTDERHAEKAEAWASILDIDPEEIPQYVRTLTAARLLFDTRVTNHGFAEGDATSLQSLLQAGTAVLVDRSGVPRVKCNCGNPLLEPASLEDAGDSSAALETDELIANPEEQWDRFDPERTVTVAPAEQPLSALTIRDLENREGLLERPIGSDGGNKVDTGTGDVKLTLRWSSDADLDLHVIEPNGNEIYFGQEGPTRSGGLLDVDANVGCDQDGSLENIFWPPGEAPDGDYVVEVVGFSVAGCGGGSYELTVQVAGDEPQIYRGTVGEDETDSYDFSSPGTGLGEVTETTDPPAIEEPAADPLAGESLSASALGPIEVGMARSEIEEQGIALVDQGPFCASPEPNPNDVFFEFGPDDTVAAIGLGPSSPIATEAGLMMGDDPARVSELYGPDAEQVSDDPAAIGQGSDFLVEDGDHQLDIWSDAEAVVGIHATIAGAGREEYCA
jgi:hypothetical protein